LPTFRDGPFVWSDEAVLVDTVEHLNVSEDDMHWPAHLAQCPQQFQCSKATIGNHNHRSPRQPSPHLPYHLSGPIRQLLVSMISVRGSVVKGLRRLETVMPRPAVPKESAPEASDSTTADHWLYQVAITGANWVTIDPLAAIRFPRRRSIVSSSPITSTPVGANTTIK